MPTSASSRASSATCAAAAARRCRRSVTGPLDEAALLRQRARIADGRVRHLSLPHALEAINGTISFDAGGIRVEDVDRTRRPTDRCASAAASAMNGFVPGELSLTAVGEQMRMRYPEGFRSMIDADLWLRGDVGVADARRHGHGAATRRGPGASRSIPNLFDFVGGGPAFRPGRRPPQRSRCGSTSRSTRRRRSASRTTSPTSVASAELKLQGTYDRAAALRPRRNRSRQHRLRGQPLRRDPRQHRLPEPAGGRIEPLFDIEAETRVRVPQQTYPCHARRERHAEPAFRSTLGSDPPLPDDRHRRRCCSARRPDVDERGAAGAAVRQAATEAEEALIRAAGARLIAESRSRRRCAAWSKRRSGLDTAQITPTIGTENDPLTPSARLILGKRLSPRAYLTFSRALGSGGRATRSSCSSTTRAIGSASSSRR